MDVDKRLDEQWPAIVADPEAWARSVAWALPLEHPGKAIVALAMRQGMTQAEGQALFDRLFDEWKRVFREADQNGTETVIQHGEPVPVIR